MPQTNAYVALRAEGVLLLLDLTDGLLPSVLHWGADPGPLTPADAAALRLGGVAPIVANVVDEPVRVALLPEHHTGWVGRPGLSGTRSGGSWSPRFTTTALRLNGELLDATGPAPRLVESGVGVLQVEAEDAVAQLGLVVRVELLTGGVVRTQAEVTNLAPEAYAVHDLVLALPVPSVARDLFDLAGRWGRERSPQRREFTVGTHLREGRKGRTGADAATVLHAGVPGFTFGAGEVWGVHVGWSGNHTHYAERLSTGEQVLGGGELLLPGEVVLGQGEAYCSPWLYASYGHGLDEVARRFHRYLRGRPQHPSADRPVTLNVWEAVYFEHDLAVLTELADIAAEVGVERYVLDDGWFGARRDDHAGLGDWVVSPEVWPNGLGPLVDHVRGLGMQFGLWFEPEMVNPDSDVARAHPDWIMATGDRQPVLSRFQQVLNLSIPECYNHVRDQLVAVLSSYDIGYIKWDHNRDLIDAGTQPGGRPAVHAQTLATYRLMDELKARFPGLEIESCSSGGGRVDLGVLQRTDRVWVSDCIDPHERQLMHRWTTQLIPPEMMGSHIASHKSHTTGRQHELAFRAATALFGHLGIEWDLRQASAAERVQLAAWIAFYKQHRALLNGGDLVRIDLPDDSVMGSAVVAPDRGTAIYSFATVGRSDVALLGRLRFPGLDPARRYRVRPVLLDYPPTGLKPPALWGVRQDTTDELDALAAGRPMALASDGVVGVELTGAALATVGLMQAPVNPDSAVLFLAEAVV